MLPFLLLLTLFRGQAAPPPAVPSGAAAPGMFEDTLTGVRFHLPEGFLPQPDVAAAINSRAQAPDEDGGARCMTIPMAAAKSGEDLGMLFIVRVDNACMGDKVTPDLLAEETQRMSRVVGLFGGQALTENAVNYKLDGHDAAFAQGSAEIKQIGGGRMMHGGSACALVGKYTLCWILLDSNHKLMPVIVSSLVSFAGRPETPLVPKDVFRAW